MPFWLVKFSVSPEMKPDVIDTVAPVSLPPLSTSVTVSVPSSVTGEPPPVKVAVPPAVTTGGDVHGVERAGRRSLVPLLVLPSLTVQLMVRVVSPPPPVGSPLLGREAVADEFERGLVLLDRGVAGQRQDAVAVGAGDAVLVGEVERIAGVRSPARSSPWRR